MSHFELGFFAFGMECAGLVYSKEVNLEMNNSQKWVLFNIVSGQITRMHCKSKMRNFY